MKNFKIDNLSCKIDNKLILSNVSLNAQTGDLIAILGSNGAGKSTLLKAILNHYSITTKTGKITFNSKNITNLDTTSIAKLGFFYCMQNPIELSGVKNLDLLKLISNVNNKTTDFSTTYKLITNGLNHLSLSNEILTRDVNVNFSGGQKKKNEILQSILFNPQVLLLDEIDSGLDIDAMKIIAKYINEQKKKAIILVVSHHLEFLNYIKPTKVIVLANGKKVKEGKENIIKSIEKNGYEQFNKKSENEFSKTDPFICSTKI